LILDHLNTTTSIMAEAMLRHFAQQRVRAASAGDSATGHVSSDALECLRSHGIETEGLHCKAWGEFFGLNRPPVRFVIALRDLYAAKSNWPHDTLVAYWLMPDPGDVVGSEIDIQLAFEEAYGTLHARIQRFLSLPFAQLEDRALLQALVRIGEQS